MADQIIILDNTGNNKYAQAAREYLFNPISAVMMRVLLSNADQIKNVIKIRNENSTGGSTNRDISIGNYINAKNSTNLIVDIPLDPPVVLDGATYFQTDIEPLSEIDLLFYYDESHLENILK